MSVPWPEHEFRDTADLPWAADPTAPGVEEKVLVGGPAGISTRLSRWAPGLDTSASGVIRHDFIEEVLLLEGELTDLTLGRTFGPGHHASRPVGMPHGPYLTRTGCVMFEVRRPG